MSMSAVKLILDACTQTGLSPGMEDLAVEQKDGYLLVSFNGKFTAQAGKQVIDEMIRASQETGTRLVVLDCREMIGKMPLFEKFEVAVYGRHTIGILSRAAIIARPDQIDPDNFVVTVATNRGYNLNVFADLNEGIEWVTKEQG
ncbi:MAG: hypothetical protein LJE56_01570 [Acidiferrobacterales bacterium]|jgi:hypothetical protein|nr:hypothetical protein [Acidiferrobacterales bacterium]